MIQTEQLRLIDSIRATLEKERDSLQVRVDGFSKMLVGQESELHPLAHALNVALSRVRGGYLTALNEIKISLNQLESIRAKLAEVQP